jgi:tellurite resistance protein TerC
MGQGGEAAPAPALHPEWHQWLLFGVVIVGVMALDLFVLHRKAHEVRMREAAITGCSFVALALIFCGYVWWERGATPAQEFLTGYIVELSLSFDNLFVFLVLFKFFKVEKQHQHRVLFWGILGALILRAVFIWAGAALLNRFEWLVYVFGFFLVITGAKLLHKKEEEPDPSKNIVVRLSRKLLPVTSTPHGGRFFLVENGKRYATTLFLCLITVEATDVVFAVDSIPAIFGVTRDTFVIYSSNVFAILGLRSFFVLLALLMAAFRYLNVGLAFVLMFIGAKMLAAGLDFHVGTTWSLSVVFGILGTAIVASLVKRGEAAAHDAKRVVGSEGPKPE